MASAEWQEDQEVGQPVPMLWASCSVVEMTDVVQSRQLHCSSPAVMTVHTLLHTVIANNYIR